MGKFIVIGERIHCISPVIKKAMEEMDPEPILKRAKSSSTPAPPIWTSTSGLPRRPAWSS